VGREKRPIGIEVEADGHMTEYRAGVTAIDTKSGLRPQNMASGCAAFTCPLQVDHVGHAAK